MLSMCEQWCHSQYQFKTNTITQPNHVTTVGLASLDHSSLVWVICHDCGEQFAEISWPIGQPEIFVAKKGKQNSNISYLQHEVIFRLLWQLHVHVVPRNNNQHHLSIKSLDEWTPVQSSPNINTIISGSWKDVKIHYSPWNFLLVAMVTEAATIYYNYMNPTPK